MRYTVFLLLLSVNLFAQPKTEKVDIEGCLIDQPSFDAFVQRVCDLEDRQLELTLCEGPQHRALRDVAPLGGWGPVHTSNTSVTRDWDNIGAQVTSPTCITDMVVSVDFGSTYIWNRRNRVDMYIDSRILVNGAPALTFTNVRRIHEDERQDTNPDHIPIQQYQNRQGGTLHYERLSIPANATIQQQVRVRYNVVGSQSNSWARIYPIYYSSVRYDWEQRDEIEDVQYRSLSQPKYWISPIVFGGFEHGIDGEIPQGSQVFDNEKDYLKAVEKAEKGAEKELSNFPSSIKSEPEDDNPVIESRLISDLKKPNAVSTIAGKYKKAELVAFAKSKDIDHSGNKTELIIRLLAWAEKNRLISKEQYEKEVRLTFKK